MFPGIWRRRVCWSRGDARCCGVDGRVGLLIGGPWGIWAFAGVVDAAGRRGWLSSARRAVEAGERWVARGRGQICGRCRLLLMGKMEEGWVGCRWVEEADGSGCRRWAAAAGMDADGGLLAVTPKGGGVGRQI
ncbi:hypothetical protein ACLOJK_030623 [Asimina triloba]